MATPHALGIPASVSSFGISFVERSEDLVSERDFLVTALQVLQHIYDTRDNRSEIVTNWVWDLDPPSSTPLNISAVGRGLEEGLPITFTNSAMVLFVRWLGQISRAHKWEIFRCHYGWREGVS